MGSRNSKSNDDNEKVASNQEPINNSNILNLTKAKNRYYTLMAKLEELISKIEENKKKLISNNNNLSTLPKTKKEKKEEEKESFIDSYANDLEVDYTYDSFDGFARFSFQLSSD